MADQVWQMIDVRISNGPVKCSSDGIWCYKETIGMIDEILTKLKSLDICLRSNLHNLLLEMRVYDL